MNDNCIFARLHFHKHYLFVFLCYFFQIIPLALLSTVVKAFNVTGNQTGDLEVSDDPHHSQVGVATKIFAPNFEN
jgi:hypothetical protein